MSLLDDLLTDLKAEGDQLWSTVSGLDEDAWETPTPAAGWDVAHQIAHLLWTDEVAVLAATDKEMWDDVVVQALGDPDGYVDASRGRGGPARPGGAARPLGHRSRGARHGAARVPRGPEDRLVRTADVAGVDGDRAVHGDLGARLDVYDALGIEPEPTDRIRHVAHLGVRTRNFAFAVHELDPPADEFRVELTAPSGDTWAWGPEDAAQRVTGSAYDFCRLVTQRIHRDDTDLVATGDDAEEWLAHRAGVRRSVRARGREPSG